MLRDLEPTWLWLPIVIVASVLIALGLATKPVRRLFRPLVEPRPAWLFADPTLARREGRRSDPTGSRRPREQPGPPARRPIRARTADATALTPASRRRAQAKPAPAPT